MGFEVNSNGYCLMREIITVNGDEEEAEFSEWNKNGYRVGLSDRTKFKDFAQIH